MASFARMKGMQVRDRQEAMEEHRRSSDLNGTNAAKTSTILLGNDNQPRTTKAQRKLLARQNKRDRRQQDHNTIQQAIVQRQEQLHAKMNELLSFQQSVVDFTQQSRDEARAGQQEMFQRFETAFEFLVDESRKTREDYANIKKQLGELAEQSALQAGAVKDMVDAVKLLGQARDASSSGNHSIENTNSGTTACPAPGLPKKRGRPPKQKPAESLPSAIDPVGMPNQADTGLLQVKSCSFRQSSLDFALPKPRGRPRKRPLSELDSVSVSSSDQQSCQNAAIPKKRGRSSKIAKLAQQAVGGTGHNVEVLKEFLEARAKTSVLDTEAKSTNKVIGEDIVVTMNPVQVVNTAPERRPDTYEDSQSDTPLAKRRRGPSLTAQSSSDALLAAIVADAEGALRATNALMDAHKQRLGVAPSSNTSSFSTPKSSVRQRASTGDSGSVKYNVRDNAGRWRKSGPTSSPMSLSPDNRDDEFKVTTEESDIDMEIEDDHESDNGVADLSDSDHFHDFAEADGNAEGYQQLHKRFANGVAVGEHKETGLIGNNHVVASPEPIQHQSGTEDIVLGAVHTNNDSTSPAIVNNPLSTSSATYDPESRLDFSCLLTEQFQASQVKSPACTKPSLTTLAEAQALQIHEMLNSQAGNPGASQSRSGTPVLDPRRVAQGKDSHSQEYSATTDQVLARLPEPRPRTGRRAETAMMWPTDSQLPTPSASTAGSIISLHGSDAEAKATA